MEDKELDRLFREKLGSYEEPAGDLWPSIENSLPGAGVPSGGGNRIRRLVFAVVSAAAVLVAGYFLWKPEPGASLQVSAEKGCAFTAERQPGETSRFRPSQIPQVSGREVESAVSAKAVPGKENQGKKRRGEEGTFGEKENTSETLSGKQPVAQPEERDTSSVGKKKKEIKKDTDRPPQLSGKQPDKAGNRVYYERDFSDSEDFGRKNKNGKMLLAVNSNLSPGSSKAAGPGGLMSMLPSKGLYDFGPGSIPQIERISEVKYSMPLNVGLQVQWRINSYLALGAGVNYSMLQSKYEGLINKKFHRVKQTLHYIGIPVNLYAVVFEKRHFSFYANAGGSIEKGVRACYSFRSYDGNFNAGGSIGGVSYSVNAGLGVEYRFVPVLGLYLEPNIVYYFNSDISASIRTDQPFQARAEIGFRFHF